MVRNTWAGKFKSPLSEQGLGVTSSDAMTRNIVDEEIVFEVNEGLLYGRDIKTAIRRKMNPIHYFTVSLGEILEIRTKAGEGYLVVRASKLTGLFNSFDAMHGVYVVKNSEKKSWLMRTLFGMGEFIPLADIPKHPYLKGQNLTSRRVLAEVGNAGRFRGGLWDGLLSFFNHESVRIDRKYQDDDKPIYNIARIRNEHINGLAAMLPMVGFNTENSLIETWYCDLQKGCNEIIKFENEVKNVSRQAPSSLIDSIFGNKLRLISHETYELLVMRSVVYDIRLEATENSPEKVVRIRTYLSSLGKKSKQTIAEENAAAITQGKNTEKGKQKTKKQKTKKHKEMKSFDKDPLLVLTVILPNGQVGSGLRDTSVSLKEQIKQLALSNNS